MMMITMTLTGVNLIPGCDSWGRGREGERGKGINSTVAIGDHLCQVRYGILKINDMAPKNMPGTAGQRQDLATIGVVGHARYELGRPPPCAGHGQTWGVWTPVTTTKLSCCAHQVVVYASSACQARQYAIASNVHICYQLLLPFIFLSSSFSNYTRLMKPSQ